MNPEKEKQLLDMAHMSINVVLLRFTIVAVETLKGKIDKGACEQLLSM